MKNHLLKSYLKAVTKEMEDDYKTILENVKNDPGTAGDQGEENWKELFVHWLLPIFQIVTKGRILGSKGDDTPQIDLLILRPDYPKKLLGKKYYLASGVLAAFECKITLRSQHFEKFFPTNSKLVAEVRGNQKGTLYRELHSPIIYGLLSHSHEWKNPKSKPFENLKKQLVSADEKFVNHPCEMPSVLCVADLLTAVSSKSINMGSFGTEESLVTTYFSCPDSKKRTISDSTPIGTLLNTLLHKLAWEYPSIRTMADYFRESGVSDVGSGTARFWNKNVLSDEVIKSIHSNKLTNKIWDEWCFGFM